MKIKADIWRSDMSDPHAEFIQIGLKFTRDDGTVWAVSGERVDTGGKSFRDERAALREAISSAVEAALRSPP